jgi:hypothetical protein
MTGNSYFIHNGYVGMSYGTPLDPQLITKEDAQELMRLSNLTLESISASFPPAQFAERGSPLSVFLGNTRFLCYGDISKCGGRHKRKVETPLSIDWNKLD